MHPAVAQLIVFSSLALALPSNNQDTRHPTRDTPPEKTPPGAAHALRDPSKLKYEVAGILGAYLLWIIVTAILLAFVGVRLRRKAQKSTQSSNNTMMKTFRSKEHSIQIPTVETEGPGLKSPKSMPSLKSPRISSIKSWGKKGHKETPSVNSIISINSIQSAAHEQHKAKDMDDLSKLYAAVMARDEERSNDRNSAAQSAQTARSPTSPTSPINGGPLSPGYPPEFTQLHSLNAVAAEPRSPQSPHSPRSASGGRLHHPMAPTPIDESFPQDSDPDESYAASRTSVRSKMTPLSIISNVGSRAGSILSPKTRVSFRGQNISQPIGSPRVRDANYYEETVPLTPRLYTPGPPPPTPGNKKQVRVTIESVNEDSIQEEAPEEEQYQPTRPESHLPSSPRSYLPSSPRSQEYQHQPASPQLAQDLRQKRAPPSLALRTSSAALNNTANGASSAGANSASSSLPFRNIYKDAPLRSAPPVKTTFLDRPSPLSGGPRTGLPPQTPYSPYMPNTPMTPITPRRLMNKQELKAKRKEDKLKVLNEDDMVQTDDDMWGKAM